MINTGILLLLILASGLIYIRMAPHDLAIIHVPPPEGASPGAPKIFPGGALFDEEFAAPPEQIWQDLNAAVMAGARTRILAGSKDANMITYVSRSLVFGFPDYTTVWVRPNGQGSRVVIYGRLRFGRSDFGVNQGRIRGILDALQPLDQAG